MPQKTEKPFNYVRLKKISPQRLQMSLHCPLPVGTEWIRLQAGQQKSLFCLPFCRRLPIRSRCSGQRSMNLRLMCPPVIQTLRHGGSV